LSGEIDKQGHMIMRPYILDFVFHVPGEMDNLVVGCCIRHGLSPATIVEMAGGPTGIDPIASGVHDPSKSEARQVATGAVQWRRYGAIRWDLQWGHHNSQSIGKYVLRESI
jgi:hypothetical protein